MTHHGTWQQACAIASLAAAALLAPSAAMAGAQVEERLAPSVVAGLQAAIADRPVPADYAAKPEMREWIDAVSVRLIPKIPDYRTREDFLATVHYEATRAGLEPQLILGLIQHESNFRKYAVSTADARGYMQVMPFWTGLIGTSDQNLFNLRTNLRYGCTILRHYLNVEGGDIFRALGRYNGSLGRSEYPSAIFAAMARWAPTPVASRSRARSSYPVLPIAAR